MNKNSLQYKQMLKTAQLYMNYSNYKKRYGILIETGVNQMYEITFRYKDKYSNYEWRTQHCTVESVEECIKIYGLNECEYEILEVKKI